MGFGRWRFPDPARPPHGWPPSTAANHLVIALDDDRPVLASLDRLLSAHGHPVRTHDHERDFFHAGPPEVPACLLLDQQLENGVTGTDVHAEMRRRGWNLPTIFLSAHASIPLAVRAQCVRVPTGS